MNWSVAKPINTEFIHSFSNDVFRFFPNITVTKKANLRHSIKLINKMSDLLKV